METKKSLAIFGCGKLSEIVVDALIDGLLPEYQLVSTYSRSKEKADALATKIQNSDLEYTCNPANSLEEFLNFKPDYIVEAASPEGMKTLTFPALESGASIVSLSIGALADSDFYQKAEEVAKKNDSQIHLVSGAIGGLDVLGTASLMGDCEVKFTTEKSPESLKNTSVYREDLKQQSDQVFSGKAQEAIQLFPTKVNVAIAAALASVGTDKMDFSIKSTPDFMGDDHCISIKNDQVEATIDVYSKTSQIAGWSAINTLRNIVSPIVFG